VRSKRFAQIVIALDRHQLRVRRGAAQTFGVGKRHRRIIAPVHSNTGQSTLAMVLIGAISSNVMPNTFYT
jgi:hypothetical protein